MSLAVDRVRSREAGEEIAMVIRVLVTGSRTWIHVAMIRPGLAGAPFEITSTNDPRWDRT
jgi:hypothetical protein